VNLPAGTTIISGHLSHSLNVSFGLSARSSAADNGHGAREGRDAVTGAVLQGREETAGGVGATGGATTATCCGGLLAAGLLGGNGEPENQLRTVLIVPGELEGFGFGETCTWAGTSTRSFFNSSSRARAMLP